MATYTEVKKHNNEFFYNALVGDNAGAWIAEDDNAMERVSDAWATARQILCIQPSDGEEFDFACSQVDADPSEVRRVYRIEVEDENGDINPNATLYVALGEDVD